MVDHLQSDGSRGLPPLTPDDVPVVDQGWVCLSCGTTTRPDMPAVERLLGGWVRVHCAQCMSVQVARPPTPPAQEYP